MKIRVSGFNLEATLDSAQVFGFHKNDQGVYEGVLAHTPVKIWQTDDCLNVEGALSRKIIVDYFDLERDMTDVYEILGADARLMPAFQKYKGLRIIRQSDWEALAGFIISANNNFKRIQLIWNNLSRELGHDEYNFPDPEHIAASSEKRLRELGLGYRAPFLFQTAKRVAADAEVLDQIRRVNYEDAKKRVMAFPGVGEKVADCVLLYGFQKYEAFPVDVWIWRIVRKLYFRNRKMSERKIAEFGRRRWKHQAGFVQQFLFHGARSGIL